MQIEVGTLISSSARFMTHRLGQSLVFLADFSQFCQGVLTGCSSEFLHRLQQRLIVFLQLQQTTGRQLIHLLAQ